MFDVNSRNGRDQTSNGIDHSGLTTEDGTLLQPGEVYELVVDYRPLSRSKKSKPRAVLFEKGTRFVADDDLRITSVAFDCYGQFRGTCLNLQNAIDCKSIVQSLRHTQHDAQSILVATGAAGHLAHTSDVLGQLWALGKLTADDISEATRLVEAHEEALEMEEDHEFAARVANLAMSAAKDAHENNFPSRRGVYAIEDERLVCIYDNNPLPSESALRDEHLEATRTTLTNEGYSVVAAGQYPVVGDDAGYTRTLLTRSPSGAEWDVPNIRRIFETQVEAMLTKLKNRAK